ncbi:MAG TPA: M56 family metallopeptidase [Acidobacteriota bacterium]|nr:M56 family metallopeptidase [Acidobacteriota bacterium]
MAATLDATTALWIDWMRPMVWQTALLFAAAWLLDHLLGPRLWPPLRMTLWTVLLVKLILPPALSSPWGLLSWQEPPAAGVFQQSKGGEAARVLPPSGVHSAVAAAWARSEPSTRRSSAWPQSIGRLLFCAWGLGALLVAALRLRAWRAMRRLCGGGGMDAAPEAVMREARRAALRIGLGKLPRIVLNDRIRSPLVTGLMRPCIVIPRHWTQGDSSSLRMALLHEMAHVRRKDLWLRGAAAVVATVYWFHPAVYVILRRLEALSEICCDGTVVRAAPQEADRYRQTLLLAARDLLERSSAPPSWLHAGWQGRSALLLQRLRGLERLPKASFQVQRLVAVLLALVMLLTVVPMGASLDSVGTQAATAPVPEEAPPGPRPTDSESADEQAFQVLRRAARGERQGCLRLRWAAQSLIAAQEGHSIPLEP